MNIYQKALNKIKIALEMEVKLMEATLIDGVTKVRTEVLEPGYPVFVVSETGEEAKAPEGEHTLEDGTKIVLDAEGVIKEVIAPAVKEEKEEEVEIKIEAEEVTPTEVKEEVKVELPEEIKTAIKEIVMAVETISGEISSMKEEMTAMKSKFEKMSKTPGSSKIPTYNKEGVNEVTDSIEAKVEALKSLRSNKF